MLHLKVSEVFLTNTLKPFNNITYKLVDVYHPWQSTYRILPLLHLDLICGTVCRRHLDHLPSRRFESRNRSLTCNGDLHDERPQLTILAVVPLLGSSPITTKRKHQACDTIIRSLLWMWEEYKKGERGEAKNFCENRVKNNRKDGRVVELKYKIHNQRFKVLTEKMLEDSLRRRQEEVWKPDAVVQSTRRYIRIRIIARGDGNPSFCVQVEDHSSRHSQLIY